jgi:hypothetical protein
VISAYNKLLEDKELAGGSYRLQLQKEQRKKSYHLHTKAPLPRGSNTGFHSTDVLFFAIATANRRMPLNIDNIAKQVRQEIGRLSKVLHLLEGTAKSKGRTIGRKVRKISAAGGKRIAAAQRARWAKIRAANKK